MYFIQCGARLLPALFQAIEVEWVSQSRPDSGDLPNWLQVVNVSLINAGLLTQTFKNVEPIPSNPPNPFFYCVWVPMMAPQRNIYINGTRREGGTLLFQQWLGIRWLAEIAKFRSSPRRCIHCLFVCVCVRACVRVCVPVCVCKAGTRHFCALRKIIAPTTTKNCFSLVEKTVTLLSRVCHGHSVSKDWCSKVIYLAAFFFSF